MPRVQSLKDKAVRMPAQVAVIYARYSSDSQREASIEDQLRECRQWAEAHGFQVVEEYCDYAISGRTDDRPQFQKMIADAEKGMFSAVIMYQTSRFTRNRYDAALYKHRLKKAGVAVHYAAMSIPDGPEGIILEALMEGMDEFYSANLSKQIRRGQKGNALKAIAMNAPPLGLMINADQRYDIDPDVGPHVLHAFQMIDQGHMQTEVIEYFNAIGLKTSKGNTFNKSSLRAIWSNRKYLGEYRYNDVVIPGAIPQLIPEDLFLRVNARIAKNKHKNGGRARSMTEFLLTGKLICGHCGCAMVGDSGTSKSGDRRYYYSCITRKRKHACKKLSERQEALEIAIVRETVQHVLQPHVLSSLIDRAMEIYEKELREDPLLRTLQSEQKHVETSLRNLLRAIEDGLYTPATKKRLEELEQQQAELSSRIAIQESSRPKITRGRIQFFLESFQDGNVSDPEYRRKVLDTLVHSVTVSDCPAPDDGGKPDRKLRIVYNLTENNTSTIDFGGVDVFGCEVESSTKPPSGSTLGGVFCFSDTLVWYIVIKVFCTEGGTACSLFF